MYLYRLYIYVSRCFYFNRIKRNSIILIHLNIRVYQILLYLHLLRHISIPQFASRVILQISLRSKRIAHTYGYEIVLEIVCTCPSS